jgi:hypothetical protein
VADRLLELGVPGQRLVLVLGEPYDDWPPSFRDAGLGHGWCRAQIQVEAGPFVGTIDTVVVEADYREAAASFRARGTARFGGNRDALVVLERDGSTIEATVTMSEDDPQFMVRYLIFESAGQASGDA